MRSTRVVSNMYRKFKLSCQKNLVEVRKMYSSKLPESSSSLQLASVQVSCIRILVAALSFSSPSPPDAHWTVIEH